MTDERNRDWAAIHDPATTADQLTVIGQRYPEFLPAIVERLSAPSLSVALADSTASGAGVEAENHDVKGGGPTQFVETGEAASETPGPVRRGQAGWIIAAVLVALWGPALAFGFTGEGDNYPWWVLLALGVAVTAAAIAVLVASLVHGRGTGGKLGGVALSFAVFWVPAIGLGVYAFAGYGLQGNAVRLVGLGIGATSALLAWLVSSRSEARAYWSLAVSVVVTGAVIAVLLTGLLHELGMFGAAYVVTAAVLLTIAFVVVPVVSLLVFGRRLSLGR